ncbi:hypothetical protein HJD18_07010 [Thermoleophilia bacterium SCSIO 60948]|nr:hypothetical protein HJD18_07010 [Thermoleophilia bacterium SCSIO 60948]
MKRIAYLVSLFFAFGMSAAQPSLADIRSFDPVQTTKRAMVFAPHELEQVDVSGSTVRMRSAGGRERTRDIRVERVTRAIDETRNLRVRKGQRIQSGKLTVEYEPRPTPPVDPEQPAEPQEPVDPGCVSTLTSFSEGGAPPACWTPFAANSPFNSEVGSGDTIDSNSNSIVDRMIGFSGTGPDKFAPNNAGTSDDWNHPIYFSEPTDPVYTVRCTYSASWGPCGVEGMQVRIPAEAQPAAGGDGHMAVIDQATGWEYDFWQVRNKPAGGGTLTVSYGGRTQIDGKGLGAQATASYFALSAGVIRPQEMLEGEINHALFIVVKCTNDERVWPATGGAAGRPCSDLGLSNRNAPAMGQHFVLDMTAAEIDALREPEWKKTILHAMAEYGMYVGDTGGNGWGITVESGSSQTSFGKRDPWTTVGQRLNIPTWDDGTRVHHVFDMRTAVDWKSQLEVVAPAQ